MSRMMYCPHCKQNVKVEPQYSVVALVLLLCIGLIPGLIYYVLKKDRQCPICKTGEELLEPYSQSHD